jgi:hypothetical protein
LFQISKRTTYIVEKNFVQTVRAVEHSLGFSDSLPGLTPWDRGNPSNATQAIATTATLFSVLDSEVCKVLQEAVPIILEIALELNINLVFEQDGLGSFLSTGRSLVTMCVLISLHNVLIMLITTLQLYGCRLAV